MNPANFQNMAGQGVLPQGHPGAPQPQQRGGITHQAVQQQIYRMLTSQQSQQNLQGWQASVQIQLRVYIIYQLVTSLRLIKPQMNIEEAIHVAVGFEQRTIFDSPDKTAYDLQCRQKIAEIAQTRSKIATSVQQQVQNGQPSMNPGQSQARMQGMVSNHDQTQMQQGFPNGQIPRPNQPPAIGVSNQQQMPMGNPQARNQAVPPNMPQMVPPPGQFTQQEYEEISQLAQHMVQNTPPDQLDRIRARLENIPQRQQIIAQGLDPLTQWFKQQATKRYIELRRAQAQRNSQLGQAPNNGNPEQPRPMSQNTAHTQGPQVPAASAPQSFDPGFMGNVGHIFAQQQNARRLAEAGHAVVPASNVQAMGEQQRTAMRATPQQSNQTNATRPPQTPNVPQQPQAFWNAQGQQQPAGQVQNQSQPNAFPSVATPIPAHLQGQVGGLNTPIGRMQPQNTTMPTLTRGVGPSQTPQPQSMWPQQGNPPMQNAAQGTPPNSQQSNPNGAPQRPRPPPGKMNNAQLQQYLSTLPETDRRTFIMHLQQQQQQQRAAASGLPPAGRPEPVTMQTQRSQAGPVGSQPTSQIPGHALSGNQQANGLQQQQVPPQQPGQPQRPPQQLGDAAQMARQRQQAALASGSLTPEMEQAMDKYPYPPGILNANNALSKLPPTVKAWGQLKAWVKENAGSLPPGSEGKLRGLQGLHYQSMSQRQQNNQQQPGMQPTAQMMPRQSQQAVSAQMPNMAPPTIQEIHMTRSKIPQLQPATDEQVRNFLIKQRQEAWARARQPALNPQQQAQMQFMQDRQHQMQFQHQQQQLKNQSLQPDAQPGQAPHGQAGPQKPQPQQPKKAPQSKEQPQGRAPQAPMQVQATNKRIKRGNSDDVVEVPDPKLAQQQRSQTIKASQKPSTPSMRSEQAAQTAQKQKGGQGAEQRAKAAQSTQAQQGNQVTNGTQAQAKSEETIQIEAKLKKLIDEVSRSTSPPQPVPMDAGTRARMIPKLAQAQTMLVRLDNALPLFYRMFGAEDITRELIRIRLLLKAQHDDTNQPINNFTISSEELDKSCNMLLGSFSHIMARVAQEKEKAEKAKGNTTQECTQGPQTQQEPAKQQPPVLSAANLQQHQNNMQAERQASVQKSYHHNNRAPPAPTSDKPPYTFGLGAKSPHGIPVYGPNEGPNELTQDNLKLPISKKRKTNNQPTSSASTPAQQAGTPHQKPSPRVKTDPSPEVRRVLAPIMYRCMVPNCSGGSVGFGSQNELDKHNLDVHQPKEPVIEDPLQFALEQIRFALNLDDNGKAKPKANGATVPAKLGASIMKKSASMQGTPAMKQETATPMSRVPTHAGPSPASHLLKTPQASGNIKTPMSETKSLLKDGVAATAPNPLIVTEDPWADSLIQQDTIHEAFSGLSSLNGPKAWTKIQDYHLTPESMSSDNNTSPRPSDISENDVVKINMEMSVDDKSWIPVNWSDPMMTELEELDLGSENWAGGAGAGTGTGADMMDWETLFGESVEEAQAKAKVAQRKYMRDPHGPTEEWLKVYGPMWGLKDEDRRR